MCGYPCCVSSLNYGLLSAVVIGATIINFGQALPLWRGQRGSANILVCWERAP
jgi:hypothetical protein